MPTLANPKQERFAQELANDVSVTMAYQRAGYKPDKSNSWVLSKRPKIVQRVSELRRVRLYVDQQILEDVAEKHTLTKERILEELIRIGFANLYDFFDFSQPAPVIKLQNLTREKAAALSEITVDIQPDGKTTRIKLKLYDKRSTLIDLGKHLGLFKEDEVKNLTFIQVVQKALAVPLDQIPPPPWLKDITPPRKKGEE